MAILRIGVTGHRDTGIDATLILSGPIRIGPHKSIDLSGPEILVSIGLLIILMSKVRFN
ncbi:hypothetical protein X947_3080 [Burkholderia pseudomallei MSHR7334]|nr:hypothetical protein X947_3080 [Burkholderia pseudomallei MSHR7334]